MSNYYCHTCARSLGLLTGMSTGSLNLTGNSYLLGKYEKHTQIPTGDGVVSIYDDPSYNVYHDYTISGCLSGSLELDSQNRKNLIWYAGQDIGVTYEDQTLVFPADTVKVVLPEATGKLHSFPVNSSNYTSSSCINCGKLILC